MAITTTQSVISTTSILSECLLLCAFAFRRPRRFWFVALYALYHLTFTAVLRVCQLKRSDLSDVVYYVDVWADFALLTAVIIELFTHTVGHLRSGFPQMRKQLVRGLTAGVSFAGLLFLLLSPRGHSPEGTWSDRIDLLTSFLLCTFMLMSTLTANRLGARRSLTVKVISRGLTLWASLAMIVDLCHMNAMWLESPVFDEVSNAAWTLMIMLWTLALVRSDQPDGMGIRSSS